MYTYRCTGIRVVNSSANSNDNNTISPLFFPSEFSSSVKTMGKKRMSCGHSDHVSPFKGIVPFVFP